MINNKKDIIKSLLLEYPIDTIVQPNQNSYYTITDTSNLSDITSESDIYKHIDQFKKEIVFEFLNTIYNFVFVFLDNSYYKISNTREPELKIVKKENLQENLRKQIQQFFGDNKKIVFIHKPFFDQHSFLSISNPSIIKHDLAHSLYTAQEERSINQQLENIFENISNLILSVHDDMIVNATAMMAFYEIINVDASRDPLTGVVDPLDVLPNFMKPILTKNNFQTNILHNSEELFENFISTLKRKLTIENPEISLTTDKEKLNTTKKNYFFQLLLLVEKYVTELKNRFNRNDFVILLGVKEYAFINTHDFKEFFQYEY